MMLKWMRAAGAAEASCEPWVLHQFVRAFPWSHARLRYNLPLVSPPCYGSNMRINCWGSSRAREAVSSGSWKSTGVGSAAARYAFLPSRPLDPLPLFVSEFCTQIVR
ncbi:hypothetical protein VPH35_001098 [Triticum aestivum]|uniref:Uncharacterized protein n=1 Tax=Triticum urartu TaxID=4572 RepID=A0A8R7JWG6_TRIUA